MGRSNVTECVLLWSSSSSSNNNSSSSSCKWVNWRACSVLVTLVCLVVVPLHCGVMVTAQATSPSKPGSSSSRRNDVNPPPHVHHIAALLEAANHSSTQAAFLEAISAANRDPHSPVTLQGVSLAQQTDPPFYLAYICDAILNHNVTTFVAIGSQKMINILSIVTTYVGIPVIGYNTQARRVAVQVSFKSLFSFLNTWQTAWVEIFCPSCCMANVSELSLALVKEDWRMWRSCFREQRTENSRRFPHQNRKRTMFCNVGMRTANHCAATNTAKANQRVTLTQMTHSKVSVLQKGHRDTQTQSGCCSEKQ